MENENIIYWQRLVELLRQNQNPKIQSIDFKNEKIGVKDVALLNRFGYRVPEQLIYYNDHEIDFTDDPDITDSDIISEKIKWIYRAEIQLKPEVSKWIKQENVDVKQLISTLLENFYQSMKTIPKNAAL